VWMEALRKGVTAGSNPSELPSNLLDKNKEVAPTPWLKIHDTPTEGLPTIRYA
jgi:hypothetical protein